MPLIVALLLLSRLEDAPPDPGYPDHLRFGIGLISGATVLNPGPGERNVPTLLGGDLRLGLRLNDSIAVMYDGSFTLVDPQFSGGVLVEWTPLVFISGALGAAVNWLPAILSGGPSSWAWGIGVPIRIALNLPLRNERVDHWRRREAIAFTFTVTPGYTFAGDVTFQNGFQIGFMGGLSFEMY